MKLYVSFFPNFPFFLHNGEGKGKKKVDGKLDPTNERLDGGTRLRPSEKQWRRFQMRLLHLHLGGTLMVDELKAIPEIYNSKST